MITLQHSFEYVRHSEEESESSLDPKRGEENWTKICDYRRKTNKNGFNKKKLNPFFSFNLFRVRERTTVTL